MSASGGKWRKRQRNRGGGGGAWRRNGWRWLKPPAGSLAKWLAIISVRWRKRKWRRSVAGGWRRIAESYLAAAASAWRKRNHLVVAKISWRPAWRRRMAAASAMAASCIIGGISISWRNGSGGGGCSGSYQPK
jgi:hypothetical protein